MSFYWIGLELCYRIILKNYPSQHLSGETKEKHETRQAEEQISSLLASGYEPHRTSGWVTSWTTLPPILGVARVGAWATTLQDGTKLFFTIQLHADFDS